MIPASVVVVTAASVVVVVVVVSHGCCTCRGENLRLRKVCVFSCPHSSIGD